ncbi:MAG: MarR family transcriptional regulator [Pirellulales bacterium]
MLSLMADGIEEVVNHIGDGKLGYRDFIILCNIAAHPGATAKDLIEATGFDQAQISRILLRFIDGHLIRRLSDPNESRRYRYFIQPGDTAKQLLYSCNLILERTAKRESPAVGQMLLAATKGNNAYRQQIWKQVKVIFERELNGEYIPRPDPISSTAASSGTAINPPRATDSEEDFRRRFMLVIKFLSEWSSDGRKHRHFALTRG